jgi:quercetin dioxygenase-like cupin family protein
MKTVQAIFLSAMFTFASFVAPMTWAQVTANHVMISPKDLKWEDISALPKGAKMAVIQGPLNEAKPFIIRVKFPANYKIPAHSHPGLEHVTVISGTFYMGTGDKLDQKNSRSLSSGSVAIIQPNVNHFAWTKGPTIIQIHGVGPWWITYVNPEDDPRKK